MNKDYKDNLIFKLLPPFTHSYLSLIRLDKPIGFLLLFYPIGFVLASSGNIASNNVLVLLLMFFLGSIIGMTPQLFVGASLGAGLNKILEENSEIPSLFQLFLTPDIYLPITGIMILVFIGFLLRKKFYTD